MGLSPQRKDLTLMQFPKGFIWASLLFAGALAIYAISKQEQAVDTIEVGGGPIVGIKFRDSLKKISTEDLQSRQIELERKLSEYKQALERQPQTGNIVPVELNLAGAWRSNLGSIYTISQSGNAIAIQEFTPPYGITAVGQGWLSQGVINVNYMNALYQQGTGTIQVLNDRYMQGRFALAGAAYATDLTFTR
jgi:hypothetical protein